MWVVVECDFSDPLDKTVIVEDEEDQVDHVVEEQYVLGEQYGVDRDVKGNLDVLANQKETCTMKTGLLGVDEIQQSNDAQVCRQSLVRHQPRQRLVGPHNPVNQFKMLFTFKWQCDFRRCLSGEKVWTTCWSSEVDYDELTILTETYEL